MRVLRLSGAAPTREAIFVSIRVSVSVSAVSVSAVSVSAVSVSAVSVSAVSVSAVSVSAVSVSAVSVSAVSVKLVRICLWSLSDQDYQAYRLFSKNRNPIHINRYAG